VNDELGGIWKERVSPVTQPETLSGWTEENKTPLIKSRSANYYITICFRHKLPL
jgi:hypothetical protein